MKMSIITICYNNEDTIAETIESVVGQTYPDIEYIVVVGASQDNTPGIVQKYADHIAKIISEPDRGIYDALNKGVALATGDVIGLVHADDQLAGPNVLASVESAFLKNNVDGVYGDLEYVCRLNHNKVFRYWESGHYGREKLRLGWMPPHTAFFLRREVYERVRLNNAEYYDTNYHIAGDYDFMLRVLWKFNASLAYLPRVIVRMSMGGKSNKSIRAVVQKSLEDYKSLKKNKVGGFVTLTWKNIRKIPQLFRRKRQNRNDKQGSLLV